MSEERRRFWHTIGRILNSGQSRSVVLGGNIHDLFPLERDDGLEYVTVVDLLTSMWDLSDWIIVVYEINGPIRFADDDDRLKVKEAWLRWRTGLDADSLAVKKMLAPSKVRGDLDAIGKAFDTNLNSAIGKPTLALELLRQMCLCSRTEVKGAPLLRENLIVIIEGADMLIPEGEISHLSDADRHRVGVCQDWFSDPGFVAGEDAVIMVAESRGMLNHRVARLPQIVDVSIPAPDEDDRAKFIEWFTSRDEGKGLKMWGTAAELARASAGLSVQALMQMLKAVLHEGRTLTMTDVVAKVEEHIKTELGEDMVEFKKPGHSLADVVGYDRLKEFLRKELMPRLQSTGGDALPGAAVCGPIGSGKTYIFEAVAGELGTVVLILKNIRSQWFGQTDVLFERLRRVLEALSKVLIFIDEADTQLGGVGKDAHPTERRLTGKIQAMMSDPALRGRVAWLLMTARIHLLSPDIRRPGRVGDLIIPILDPSEEDRKQFIRWMVAPALGEDLATEQMRGLDEATEGFSAATFASLRGELKAKAARAKMRYEDVLATVRDRMQPAIGLTRRYQALQALTNCTRRSLLPDPEAGDEIRAGWEREMRHLEAQGIS